MLPSNDDFLLIIYGPFRNFRVKNHEKYHFINIQILEKMCNFTNYFLREFVYLFLIC